jgi:hypothetical protein
MVAKYITVDIHSLENIQFKCVLIGNPPISLLLRPTICFPFQTATIFASANGLKVTVEDSKCVQANAFLQNSVFQEYTINEEHATFKINLTVLLVGEIFSQLNDPFFPSQNLGVTACVPGLKILKNLGFYPFFTEVRGTCRKQLCLFWLPRAVDLRYPAH